MRFKNREEAAAPRGAVLMAKIIADELEGELNVVLVHKLRAPFQDRLTDARLLRELGGTAWRELGTDHPCRKATRWSVARACGAVNAREVT